ncbi:DNA polymerase IV [Fructilactobacillus fructivorans]|uniref:DNA polymerase IV n=1 Tax=Fructilactobacillus fructivorans TaxID=1614 RepID=UPI0009E5E287|nr:DNA polymerase IV [Fructilactobacillus fructivorans]
MKERTFGGLRRIILEESIKINHSRDILHVDMDAFFASIEQREHPEFIDQPLIISKDPRKTGGRGVVTTANYPARKFGVHSAMPASKALELCPNGIFKAPEFELYRDVSHQIHDIFHEYTDRIETVALDEAYLDITKNKKQIRNPVLIAHLIQSEIWEKTHLTSSTGISYNKFLAKEASDYRKPAGVTMIDVKDSHEFLMKLPIDRYRGVGKKTLQKMQQLNIQNGQDLYRQSEMDLIKNFGKFGYFLYRRVRGSDDRPVEYQRERKSIGKERTYGPELKSREEVESQLHKIAKMVEKSLNKHEKHGKVLVLKVRYSDFTTLTKRISWNDFMENDARLFYDLALEIFDGLPEATYGIRLLGITLTNLSDIGFQNIKLPLYSDPRFEM